MDHQMPLVSAIVPARNESKRIRRCLDALLAQDYPADCLEIIVVDGCSTDGTREIAMDYARRHEHLRVLDNPRRIVPVALNIGLRDAKGAVIVRIDGHCVPASDYVSRCVERLLASGAVNVGGPMRAVGEGYAAQAIALATSSRFGVGNALFHYADREQFVDTVYLGAFRREVFDLVGDFDEELVRNQDDEFNYRIRAAGGKILLSPAIRSRYYCRSGFGALFRQYFQYGYWKVRVAQKHPRSLLPRHYAPLSLVLLVASLALAGGFSEQARRLLTVLAAGYLAGSLLVAARIVGPRKLRLVPAISLAFACLHFSYGAGFVAGLGRALLTLIRNGR